ncbi:MAG: NAD(P)/FAD-dependent oxidoreductase [Solirubrobacteraceae bacterium]
MPIAQWVGTCCKAIETSVDQHDYHTFQPLLYQVATDLLETTAVGHPLRDLFHDQHNITFHETQATSVDLAKREVDVSDMDPLPYDYLVLALGAKVNFFGTEGAQENAFPMYTLPDAVRVRTHVLKKWEAADKDHALLDDGALNVVVVGGGPTGVESAGALAELYRNVFSEDYPNLPQEQAQIILVEAAPELFTMFKPNLRAYANKALGKLSVEVRTGEMVSSIEPTRVTLKSGEVIQAHTLIWGAGLQANSIVHSLGLELQKGNRVAVSPDLTLTQHREVYAVGDIAWITDPETNKVLPQLGSVALQSGTWAGENIARLTAGEQAKPFEYNDKGTMATIGRGAAVVQFEGGRTMQGKMAFMAWGAVHLMLLSTGEDRSKAVVDWTWAGFGHKRPTRITINTDEVD